MIKFMILSDTHNFEASTADPCPLNGPLPKVDVVLHCGDLTHVGGLSSYKKALRLLSSFDAELKLVIAGNHDLSLDGAYWKSHLAEDDDPAEHDAAMEIMKGPLAKEAGVTYLEEGTYTFELKDGRSFKVLASPYQPEFCDWAFGYRHNLPRWKIPEDVDIVMTHGPPQDILDFCHNAHAGCKSLLQEIERVRPLLHCFGHIHEGYGIQQKIWESWGEDKGKDVRIGKVGAEMEGFEVERGGSTIFVNAAVMDERMRPVNAPWIVELPL